MKGQFMMLSAIIAGLIMVSAASLISDTSQAEFSASQEISDVYTIKDEAREYDLSQEAERRSFIRTAESLGRYSVGVEAWRTGHNVTVVTESSRYVLFIPS